MKKTARPETVALKAALLLTLLLPAVSQAQQTKALIVPLQLSVHWYVIIGGLLVVSVLMFLIFQRRYKTTRQELEDVTAELSITRNRLTETNTQLETEKKNHSSTNTRYTNILFEAGVGMFQLDLSGKCIYINDELQQMSGLYPKKAMKEGIQSAVHPDDKEKFLEAWDRFVEKDKAIFEHKFRFLLSRDRINHVVCRGRRVRNVRKNIESYIFWVTDVTPFHNDILAEKAETGRFANFINTTVEGFYKLVPESPIPLSSKPELVAEKIMKTMVLGDCNDSFSAIYGAKPADLVGKSIGEMKDGCGFFKTIEVVQEFARNEYKAENIESVRLDPKGGRVNLVHNVMGIIEDGNLLGIWGYQNDVSTQKRDIAELNNRVGFMHRILDSLPADVHVKDTRCQYLYASKKLADRTGIAQEEWIGKTIFEIMPGAPKDYDVLAVEAMKTGTLKRTERKFEAQGKKGWMENNQIPLVSKDGLVEGVISLSIDITDRKKREERALSERTDLETKLVNTQNELADSRSQNTMLSTRFSEIQQKYDAADATRSESEKRYQHSLVEAKKVEEELRRSEQGLLTRQKQLEEQLTKRLEDLDAETDKRVKWEELLQIKEDELRKLEENIAELNEHYAQETELREKAEGVQRTMQVSMTKMRAKLADLEDNRESEIEQLNAEHQTAIEAEHSGRKKAENQLARTKEFLESTQEQVKRMTEQHAQELEEEVAERKVAADKLLKGMEELETLRKEFGQRLEEETKAIKSELAQKQIREKAMRKHEKDQEQRIKELERTLNQKSKDYAEQLQAREGVEVEKNQIEQKMEKLTQQQQEMLDREREKMNLSVADIRLGEVKIRKKVKELEEAKAKLEEDVRVRENFMEKARHEQQKLEAELKKAQAKLKQQTGEQSKVIASETSELRKQLHTMEKATQDMKVKLGGLKVEKSEVEKNLETRNAELKKAAREYRKVVDAYKVAQAKLQEMTDSQDSLMIQQTGDLKAEVKKLQRSEQMLQQREKELLGRIKGNQDEMDKLKATLKDETDHRYEAEKKLRELEVTLRSTLQDSDNVLRQEAEILKRKVEDAKKNEAGLITELKLAEATVKNRDTTLADLKAEQKTIEDKLRKAESKLADAEQVHQAELKKTLAEAKKLGSKDSKLVEELTEIVRDSLEPVVTTTSLLEKSESLSAEMKRRVATANHSCQGLMNTMNYRAELNQLSSGKQKLNETNIDLHDLMTDIDKQFTPRAEANKLFFAVSFAQYQASSNVPKHVMADADKLNKTLSILLSYALDNTSKGRLGLHATREASDSDSVSIAFELAYTPEKKNDELLNGVFDSESDAVIDMKYGLTLARRYIKLLGGDVKLEQRDAGITALTVTLPFKRSGSDIVMPKGDDNSKAGAA